MRRLLFALAALGLAACSTSTVPLTMQTQTQMQSALPDSLAPDVTTRRFVGFWESWSDAGSGPFASMGTIPASVNVVAVAFGDIGTNNTVTDPQNTYSLKPGIDAIHAQGGKVLLSIGGANSTFNVTNTSAFVQNLAAYFTAHPGWYDGVDYDDERIPWNGQQQLISLINATRTRFPHKIITYDAFMSGASLPYSPGNYQGEDIAILQNAGTSLSWVNVMDYDAFGWKPPDDTTCSWSSAATNNCYKHVVAAFAAVPFAKWKIVMGLMIGKDDDGTVITSTDAQRYAAWTKSHGYRGMMIWDVNHDGAYAGVPAGTYVQTIGSALGT